MRYDVFISYRRENGFLMAQVICDRLKARGISCFLDLEEDRAGKFDENLLKAIAEAPNFLLILPKNALTRCKNQDDWVRREIMAALEGGKRIIPVMYDGFKWPKKWPEEIPEAMRRLETWQGVSMSQEYLPAMIEKIIGYLKDVEPTDGSEPVSRIPAEAVSYFGRVRNAPERTACVCMAFHAGADWRRSPEKVAMLQYFLEHKIPLKVLVNGAEAAELVCSHMRQLLKRYVGLDDCVREWLELGAAFPELIHVRVCQVPLLHRIYAVRNVDGTGDVNIKYYTYGNYVPAKDHRVCFGSDEPEYRMYMEEFEHLWERCATDTL